MNSIPLAEKLRPACLEEIIGQEHLLGEYGLITHVVKKRTPISLLLWGPPGCGKTSLARLYAQAFDASFVNFSMQSGIGEVKKWIDQMQAHPLLHRKCILFLDEIHRLNKAQQDVFLPYIERGAFILVGATTENPSFALNDALLSRLRVLPLKPMERAGLELILRRYEERYHPLPLTEDAREFLLALAQGDARHFINMIENIEHLPPENPLGKAQLTELLQCRNPLYDKSGEGHYNLISALHKSIRGSDPNAALYWLARMLEGGEDPQFLARRFVRMAVEDIGLADPQALSLAVDTWKAFDHLGYPEGDLALAQLAVYLALAPKSNSVYTAFSAARASAKKSASSAPPKIILNAPTSFMKEMGYGKGYQYDHDLPLAFSGQDYFPEDVKERDFYHPVERGFEREMKKRLEYFQKLRNLL
ncbi:MAG TPA: replication-associated recombination protein A [Rhabdochlamydiaceae bacterium]|jgi:putative ATPase